MKTIIDALENIYISAVHEFFDAVRLYFSQNPDDVETIKSIATHTVGEAVENLKTEVAILAIDSVLNSLSREK